MACPRSMNATCGSATAGRSARRAIWALAASRACRIAYEEGFAQAGQRIIVTAGVPLGTPGATNMLRIALAGTDADTDI